MNKVELLAPAGSFEIGKAALYSGADAIYLALESYGARAYAKNFTIDELKEILQIAHVLNKKVFVTVNTIIKNNELADVYKFIDEIYLLGVDAVICADIAVFMYIINNCSGMEAHISTQAGVKDLNDTLFFEDLGAHRVVIAREDSVEEIKNIKKNSNIDLEVFIHGALCVSYSGGCLFSSLLSLRSGNRGRCSQNCRREYVIYENNKPISKPGYYLSLKDLCVRENVNELVNIGVNSLKIEGRMKNINYVNVITEYYRNLIDNNPANFDKVNQIFHRQFTKGFVFNEDRIKMATITDSSSVGKAIGTVIKKVKNKVLIKTNTELRINERIRFVFNEESIYFTVDKIYDLNNRLVDSLKGELYIECDLAVKDNSTVYKMQDSELNNIEINNDLVPLNLFINGKLNEPLVITASFNDNYLTIGSEALLSPAVKNPITEEILYQQLNKFGDLPFYIDDITLSLDEGLFISVAEINKLRRKLVNEIFDIVKVKRDDVLPKKLFLKKRSVDNTFNFVAFVNTIEQYNACNDMGLENIFYNNISPYVGSKYNDINEQEVLVGNYGGLRYYQNKTITTDYSFNVINKDAILHLINFGAAHVTLSPEISFNEIKELSNDFNNTYGVKAPLDMIVYGKQKLMTMKYCPLKKLGLCGQCRKNQYYLVDKLGKFRIKTKENCIVEIYNDLPLNLIDEINLITPHVDRLRFDFTFEDYEEVTRIIKYAYSSLDGSNNKFNSNKETRGYFKRKIL